MDRYLARSCPRCCNGYLGIILREPGCNTPLQAVNGHCLRCGHPMAWIVIRGNSNKRRVLKRIARRTFVYDYLIKPFSLKYFSAPGCSGTGMPSSAC